MAHIILLATQHGKYGYRCSILSINTPKAVRSRLNRLGVKTLFIEPGSPREKGYIESFSALLF